MSINNQQVSTPIESFGLSTGFVSALLCHLHTPLCASVFLHKCHFYCFFSLCVFIYVLTQNKRKDMSVFDIIAHTVAIMLIQSQRKKRNSFGKNPVSYFFFASEGHIYKFLI